jgi:hypothetical protein
VNSFQKDMLIKDFIKWIRENIHKFDKWNEYVQLNVYN